MQQLAGASTLREALVGRYSDIIALLMLTGVMMVALGLLQSGQTAFVVTFSILE